MTQDITTLLEEKRIPQAVQMLREMNPADIAAALGELPEEYLTILFRILPKELAAQSFVLMDADRQESLITAFSDRELKEVLDELFVDDTVDIIEEMPANVVKRILSNCDPARRRAVNELLNYPDDSAGSIMTIEYVDLRRDMTVREAFAHIRRTGPDKETIYTCYVTDEGRRLLGLVTVKTLLLADSESVINDIMESNVICANTLDDKEEIAGLFDKYDFLTIPVVDKEHRLVGIVTVDDAMDVMREENTEDILKMSAIQPSESSYFKTSVFKHARSRIVWLLILMLSATITGAIITRYETAIAAIPVLVAFLPMLMDTGGNCGAQASTMIVRGLALGDIHTSDIWRALFKELRIALLIGVTLAAVNTVRILLMYSSDPLRFKLALVTGLSLMGAVVLAKCLGCILPIVAKKVRLDPAIMASPLITTTVDACSVLLYFAIASKVLAGIIPAV